MLAGQFRNSCRERVLKDMKRRRGYSTNRNRIKSRKGFSLTEMLVTVLLMSLATLAVAAGVTAAVRTYRSMTLKAEAQTLLGTAIAAVDDDFASADLSTLTIGENEASFFSGNRGYDVHIHNDGDTIYLTDAQGSSSDSEVIDSASASGAIPIVTSKTRTQNLKLKITNISIAPSASETSGVNSTRDPAPTDAAGPKLSDSNPYFTYTISVLHGNDNTVVESKTVKTAVIAGYPGSTDSNSDTGK